MKTHLANELYGTNVLHDYPCGCKFKVTAEGHYVHYCNPNCRFDRAFVGKEELKGYQYVGWEQIKAEIFNSPFTKRQAD